MQDLATSSKPLKCLGALKNITPLHAQAANLYNFGNHRSNYEDDNDDDDDDSDSDDDNMLSRVMRNSVAYKTQASPFHDSKISLDKFNESPGDAGDILDYGYGDDDDVKTSTDDENQERHHYVRRNSCLINKDKNMIEALVDGGSLLAMNDFTIIPATEGPPRLSDRDLQFEQQRKADLVIAMYNQ